MKKEERNEIIAACITKNPQADNQALVKMLQKDFPQLKESSLLVYIKEVRKALAVVNSTPILSKSLVQETTPEDDIEEDDEEDIDDDLLHNPAYEMLWKNSLIISNEHLNTCQGPQYFRLDKEFGDNKVYAAIETAFQSAATIQGLKSGEIKKVVLAFSDYNRSDSESLSKDDMLSLLDTVKEMFGIEVYFVTGQDSDKFINEFSESLNISSSNSLLIPELFLS